MDVGVTVAIRQVNGYVQGSVMKPILMLNVSNVSVQASHKMYIIRVTSATSSRTELFCMIRTFNRRIPVLSRYQLFVSCQVKLTAITGQADARPKVSSRLG